MEVSPGTGTQPHQLFNAGAPSWFGPQQLRQPRDIGRDPRASAVRTFACIASASFSRE
jgi:hypothetical protein